MKRKAKTVTWWSQRQYGFLAFLISIIILLSLIRIQVIHDLSPKSFAFADIQKEILMQRQENMIIRAETLDAMSLREIDAKARSQGFIDCPNCQYKIKK